jgi:hypothetical protein
VVLVFHEVDMIHGQQANALDGFICLQAQKVGRFAKGRGVWEAANAGRLMKGQTAEGLPGLLGQKHGDLIAMRIVGRISQIGIKPFGKLIVAEVL